MDTDSSILINIADIKINRERRQRRTLEEIKEMELSLSSVGQIQPVVIDDEFNLLVGERRITAAANLGWTQIRAELKRNLSPIQKDIIELDENLRRVGLSWPDECRAYEKIVSAMQQLDPELTQAQIANQLGIRKDDLSMRLTVAQALSSADAPLLEQMPTARTAYNHISRQISRAADSALEQLLAPPAPVFEAPIGDEDAIIAPAQIEPIVAPKPNLVACADFVEFATNYTGERFNFIHCDFPYGISHGKSSGGMNTGNSIVRGAYDDGEDVYWELLGTLLANKDTLIASSAHIMFWFSMNYYIDTVQMFREHGFTVNPMPLIWYKSDNTGILPDPNRGPRQIYETALLINRGDRKIAKAVANAFSYPGNKDKMIHTSEKPIPMLEHFFSMFVDSSTNMLDPSCGSGNSLCAAWSKGGRQIRGLELDSTHAESANARLNFHIGIHS